MIAAYENDADLKIHIVDLMKGEHKQPEHLARQPFGVIPALEDGVGDSATVSLYESRAITRYIDSSRGRKLQPSIESHPQQVGWMEQWISLEQGTITPIVEKIVIQRVFAPFRGQKADEEIVAKAVEQSKQPLDIMDRHLDGKQYLAGDVFTLADAYFMPYFHHIVANTPEKEIILSRPNLAAWWKRISERPSWKKVLQAQQQPQQ